MSMCLFHFHLTINSAASITDQAFGGLLLNLKKAYKMLSCTLSTLDTQKRREKWHNRCVSYFC